METHTHAHRLTHTNSQVCAHTHIHRDTFRYTYTDIQTHTHLREIQLVFSTLRELEASCGKKGYRATSVGKD